MRLKVFRKKALVFVGLCLILCSACGKKASDYDFYLYFGDPTSSELVRIPAQIDRTMETSTMISSIFASLKTSISDASTYLSLVPEGVNMNSFSLKDNDLVLDFNQQYPSCPSREELLLRASLVLTYMQLDEISTVEIRVEGQPLTNTDGTVIGPQSTRNFTDIMGKGLNRYSEMDATVYFASESGDKLVPSTVHLTYLNASSLQQALVQRLIEGPGDDAAGQPVFPPNTKLISVTTKDGICHVNLNSELLNEAVAATPEVQVWSLVNTLTETRNVSSVMISINGSSGVVISETIDLSSPLSRNLDLVENLEEEKE